MGIRMGAVATGMMSARPVLAKAGTWIGIALVVVAAAALVTGMVCLLHVHGGGQRIEHGGIHALSAKLCGGAKEIDEKTGRCLKDIEDGGGPADALARSSLFSGCDCRLLKLAEQTGSLPDTLEDLAQRQEEESLRRIDRAVGAIEPAIVVITSALAGVILLSVMLPLMGLLSAIG